MYQSPDTTYIFPGIPMEWGEISVVPHNANNNKQAYIRKVENSGYETLYPVTFEGIPHEKTIPDGLFLLSLLLLALFAQSCFYFRNSIINIIKAPFSKIEYKRFASERSLIFDRLSLNLIIIFLFSASICILWILDLLLVSGNDIPLWPYMAITSIILIIIIFVKISLTKIIGVIFNIKSISTEYSSIFMLCIKGIGILLFPIALMLPIIPEEYYKWLLYLYAGIGSMYFLTGIIRALGIISGNILFSLFMIAYICMFEIMPVLVLYRFVFQTH